MTIHLSDLFLFGVISLLLFSFIILPEQFSIPPKNFESWTAVVIFAFVIFFYLLYKFIALEKEKLQSLTDDLLNGS